MKAWLKGGLIAVGIQLVLTLISYMFRLMTLVLVNPIIFYVGNINNLSIPETVFGILLSAIVWFIVGAIIGFIVGIFRKSK